MTPSRSTSLLAALAGAAIAASLLVLPGLTQPDSPGSRPPPGGPGHRDMDRPDAHPDGTPEGRPEGRPGDRAPPTADQLRARLQRRLEDTRLIQQRLEAAIASLDSGTAPEVVMRTLFEPRDGDARREPRDFDQPGRGFGGPDPRAPLTTQEREQLLAYIGEHMPRVAAWLTELERDDPRLLEAVRTRLAPQLREIQRLRERDPVGAQARTEELIATMGVMRATRLHRAAARAGADSPAAIQTRAALRDALATQFDARLAASRHELTALAERIKSLEADIASQTDGRDAHVDSALDRITQDALRPPPPEPPPGG